MPTRRVILGALLSTPVFAKPRDAAPVDTELRTAVDRGEVPGVVAMAASRTEVLYHGAFGKRDVAANVPMTEDTIFRSYSMTKPVTSVAAMQLVERGKVTLGEPVAKYLPAVGKAQVFEGFRNGQPQFRPPKSPVTLRHLLSHTSGYAYGIWNDRMRDYTAIPGNAVTDAGPLIFDPGVGWQYGTSTDTTGRLIEAVSGLSLEQYLQQNILQPLGMTETSYNVPASKHDRVTSTHQRLPDRSLRENPRTPLTPVSSFAGGGGLYTTAADYVKFLQMFLRRGQGILQPRTVALMARNQTGSIPAGRLKSYRPELSNDVDFQPGVPGHFGLGFLINPKPYTGGRSRGSLCWAGLGNTYFWIDPARNLCAVILMQLLPFVDTEAVALLQRFERAVYRL